MSEITIGILSPSADACESLRMQLKATGFATLKLEVDEYCIAHGDRSTRRFVESQPDIVVIDMQERAAGLQSLQILHTALPATWLFVADYDDPQVIIESMRAGAREFLPKPITTPSLQQALNRYMTEKHKQHESKTPGKIYWVTAAKCGAGSTTVAINTAVSLAGAAELKVALLDIHSSTGDIAPLLNLKPKFTVMDAFAAGPRLGGALLDSYTTLAHGVSVLAGAMTFEPGRTPQAPELARLLEVSGETYTHSFFDFPVWSDRESLRLMTQMSSAIVLVIKPDLPHIWRAERFIRFFDGDCREKIHLVVNESSRADEISDADIEKAINQTVFWKLPKDIPASSEAVNSGKPLAAIDNSELARSYRDLAQALTGIAFSEKRRGLLKLFS